MPLILHPHTDLPCYILVRSVPADTRELIQMFPSTTRRAECTHWTSGRHCFIAENAPLNVVSRVLSSRPVRAAMPAPVHTVIRYCSFG